MIAHVCLVLQKVVIQVKMLDHVLWKEESFATKETLVIHHSSNHVIFQQLQTTLCRQFHGETKSV